jgi:predicted dienelactone hydrolase
VQAKPRRHLLRAALALSLATSACADETTAPTADAAGDLAADAQADSGTDAADDLGADLRRDTAADSPLDAGGDAGDAADASEEPDAIGLPDPEAPGPFGVGYVSATVRYEPADGRGERALRTAVWYPTDATEGAQVRYFGLFRAPGVLGGVPLTTRDPWNGAGFPVLAYSHGHLGFAEASGFLAEFFASHGWVVVAPDHTGNTTADASRERETPIYYQRAWDIGAALDWLYALAPGDPLGDELGGRLREGVLLAGHSFGGYTAMGLAGATYAMDELGPACEAATGPRNFCSTLDDDSAAIFSAGLGDPRVAAVVLMAAGDYGLFGEGIGDIDIPVLHMTSALDEQTTREGSGDPIWAALDGPDDLRLDFATGGHHTFAITCALGFGAGDGCGEGYVPFAEAHAVIDAYALTFAYRHVLGEELDADLLSGARSIHADATLSRHADE